jgi:hypothetical protein
VTLVSEVRLTERDFRDLILGLSPSDRPAAWSRHGDRRRRGQGDGRRRGLREGGWHERGARAWYQQRLEFREFGLAATEVTEEI